MAWMPLQVPHSYTPAGALTHSIVLVANDMARTTFRVTSGDMASPWSVVAFEWPGAKRNTTFSGPRGTLGAQAAQSSIENGVLRVGLRLLPSAGMDDSAARVSALANVVGLMTRFGGQVTVRRTGASARMHFQVIAGDGIQMQPWTTQSEIDGRIDNVAVSFTCGPYVLGDPMEITDGFDWDTRQDHRFDTGSMSDVQVSGGLLRPASAGVTVRTALTSPGYTYADMQAGVNVTPGSVIAGFQGGIRFKVVSPTTYLEFYITNNGASTFVNLDKVVAGTRTNLYSASWSSFTPGQPVRVAVAVTGNDIDVGLSSGNLTGYDNAVMSSPWVFTLTGADATTFGAGVAGLVGLTWTPKGTDASMDQFTVRPFYSLMPAGNPAEVSFGDRIPGDAPALVRVEHGWQAGGAAPVLDWAMLSIGPDSRYRNYLQNGGFEIQTSPPFPWQVSAVTGVTGAASSITTLTGASRFGVTCGSIACPATANTGATALVRAPGGFQKGRTYTFWLWVRSAASTTARIRLGVNGDIASRAAAPLPSGWTEWSVQWTPTATVAHAYACIEITAATATTVLIDGACVTEGSTRPSQPSQTPMGRGGSPARGVLSPASAMTLTGFTLASASGWPATLGQVARRSATGATVIAWPIDPEIVETDDHQDNVDVEVWAYIVTPATFTGGSVVLTCGGVPSREFGTIGLTLPQATSSLWRVGTVSVPRLASAVTDLTMTFQFSAISGNLDVCWVIVTPPSQRVISGPVGKAGRSYVPAAFTSTPGIRRADPDGRCYARRETGPGWQPIAAMDGLIEVPPGLVSFMACFLQGYPGGGANGAATPMAPVWVSLSPVPRWHFARTP